MQEIMSDPNNNELPPPNLSGAQEATSAEDAGFQEGTEALKVLQPTGNIQDDTSAMFRAMGLPLDKMIGEGMHPDPALYEGVEPHKEEILIGYLERTRNNYIGGLATAATPEQRNRLQAAADFIGKSLDAYRERIN